MGACCSGTGHADLTEVNIQKPNKHEEEEEYVGTVTRINNHYRGLVVRCAPPEEPEEK